MTNQTIYSSKAKTKCINPIRPKCQQNTNYEINQKLYDYCIISAMSYSMLKNDKLIVSFYYHLKFSTF